MASSGDAIDFDIIEGHKENIQALPSGRSASSLAKIYSPPLTGLPIHDAHSKDRAEYEKELLRIDEADDPLDIYDRYVKWTMDTYPSAQATSSSQLLPLLERATKAFQNSTHYKNDPRYLKIWLTYIRLFSDAPREIFIFLARNGIGENLALYYEEFAAWLEGAGRWSQAEEVYRMGVDKDARPVERLNRKYEEFVQRKQVHQISADEPSSPALPVVRPALAAKIDPFATTSATTSQQSNSVAKKNGRAKMQIFADTEEPSQSSTGISKGWDNIGTIAERKKENTVKAKPMAGEKLKVGKTNGGMQKMMIFKDSTTSKSTSRASTKSRSVSKQCTINANNGKLECVFVNLEAVYGQETGSECCFEELRARQRGWRPVSKQEAAISRLPSVSTTQSLQHDGVDSQKLGKPVTTKKSGFEIFQDPTEPVIDQRSLSTTFTDALNLQEDTENQRPQTKPAKKSKRDDGNRTRKINIMDVKHIKNETKTIQLNMDSPSQVKPKRKKSSGRAEATVTINTKEAMDEIYGIYSQPLPSTSQTEIQSDDEESEDDCTTTDGESTNTGGISAPASEYGDETRREMFAVDSSAEREQNTALSKSLSQQDSEKILPTNIISENIDYAEEEDLLLPLEENYQTQHVPITSDENVGHERRFGAIPNHRLPFMTPIAEATESSLGTFTTQREKLLTNTKTPSRQTGPTVSLIEDDLLMSSPFQEVTTHIDDVKHKVLQPIRTKSTKGTLVLGQGTVSSQNAFRNEDQDALVDEKHPLIQDMHCNPMDVYIRDSILTQLRPTMAVMPGYHNYDTCGDKSAEIKRWAKAVAKATKNTTSMDKAGLCALSAPTISFPQAEAGYTFRRELGAGTFAPVYLVENCNATEHRPVTHGRRPLEAIKMESPPSLWEFFILNQARQKLARSRSLQSIVNVHEMHLYQDECFLVEDYRDQGTLLDLVNICKADSNSGAGMDETLAMFFTIELLRIVEDLHSKKIIHGDLKGDNMMVRFDDTGEETDWSATYFSSGSHGWSSKGLCLIDFGRGINMSHFKSDVGFVADWQTTEADCSEMRELRPWTYQIDYYGLAGTIHSMLFGKYMETVSEKSGMLGQGSSKTYRIRESFKRYWQTDLWTEVFTLLLNPMQHLEAEDNRAMPVVNGMRQCRSRMEEWLAENCEKGVGLKNSIAKLESIIREKKRKNKA